MSKKKRSKGFVVLVVFGAFMLLGIVGSIIDDSTKMVYVKHNFTKIFSAENGKKVLSHRTKFSTLMIYKETITNSYVKTLEGLWVKGKDLFLDENNKELKRFLKKGAQKMSVQLPKHRVIKTSLKTYLSKNAWRIEIRVNDVHLSKLMAKRLIEKYKFQSGSGGQISVRKPCPILKGTMRPWAIDNLDGKGVTFNDELFKQIK